MVETAEPTLSPGAPGCPQTASPEVSTQGQPLRALALHRVTGLLGSDLGGVSTRLLFPKPPTPRVLRLVLAQAALRVLPLHLLPSGSFPGPAAGSAPPSPEEVSSELQGARFPAPHTSPPESPGQGTSSLQPSPQLEHRHAAARESEGLQGAGVTRQKEVTLGANTPPPQMTSDCGVRGQGATRHLRAKAEVSEQKCSSKVWETSKSWGPVSSEGPRAIQLESRHLGNVQAGPSHWQ